MKISEIVAESSPTDLVTYPRLEKMVPSTDAQQVL